MNEVQRFLGLLWNNTKNTLVVLGAVGLGVAWIAAIVFAGPLLGLLVAAGGIAIVATAFDFMDGRTP